MVGNPASGPPGDAGLPLSEMDQVSQNIELLPEETLVRIGKGPLVKFTNSCEEIEKVSRVFQSLLKTYSTASLSHPHTTAACNAISAFLDAARTSTCEGTRQLARSDETWLSVFEVFMTRYKDVKPKPMKQVLESLVALLAKTRQELDRSALRQKIVETTIPSIVLGEPRARLKASFASLEMLLRKSAITPLELVSLTDQWLVDHYEHWTALFKEDCKALSIDFSQYLQRDSERDTYQIAAQILVLGMLARATKAELAASAGDTLAAFLQKVKASPNARDLTSVWVAPVRHVSLRNLDNMEYMSNYVLQPSFANDPVGFKLFIERLPLDSLLAGDMSDAPLAEFMLLFASLQIAKKIGLIHEDHYIPKAGANESDVLVLKSETIGQFLFHRDITIRIATLSLLITAPSTTRPVSSATMNAILSGLPSMHTESDSYSRGEILSMIRKLIIRLKGGLLEDQDGSTEQKAPANKKQQPKLARNDTTTRACMQQYLDFLKADLRPTASYPRHVSALKTLILFLQSGLDARLSPSDGIKTKWLCNVEVFEPTLLRLLVDLLLDPFEEVRATSLYILNLFPREVLFDNDKQAGVPQIIEGLAKAEQLASNTSRADFADTVARLYHILFRAAAIDGASDAARWWENKSMVVDTLLKKLEQKLSLAGGLFNSSMRDAPLHGYVSALRYIIATPNFYSFVSSKEASYDNWKSIHLRIVQVCDKIWNEVKPVLCIDSPEGHTDEPIEELGVGPKDILSYSWRALRESSLLLHASLSNKTYGPQGESGLTVEHFEKIGTLSFIQLAELRHRGAFSTVSQTFATCCQRCGQSTSEEISALPSRWYQEAKKIIFESASKLTRRSAGLPALIVGILSSKPGGPLFQTVINELHEISHLPAKHDKSRQDVPLPQVHAMNCLKDIFTNNKLGPHTEPFIMPALRLSAERLGSPIWALRNSGLMLFRALLTRMCRTGTGLGFGGASGSEPGARVSFQKYPGLFELLPTLLSPSDQSSADDGDNAMVTERVFPALELIAEKVPNVTGVDDDVLRGLVREQFKSPVWGIREHAARVYASLLNRSDVLTSIKALLDDNRDQKTQDYLHGEALCIKYSLRRFASSSLSFWNEHVDEVLSTLKDVFAASFPYAESPFVASILLEILGDVIEKCIESGAEGQMATTLNYLSETYAFAAIREFLFDSSHPSWKTLSTTRAPSLLRRAISWVTVLQMFIMDKVSEVEPLLGVISRFDPNAGQWLLERIQEILGERDQYRQALINLYYTVILGVYPQEVKAVAITCLASALSFVLDFHNESVAHIGLSWETLEKHLKHASTEHIWNRDRSDAELVLEGCLLALKTISGGQGSELDILEWATRLQSAMQEETEFTTRLAAVSSVTAFARILRPAGSPPRTDSVLLEIYLVLYDMLNDDDEELRDLAASTASWVLSCSSVSPTKAVALSPLNASELLSKFIAENYASSRLLCQRTMAYIADQEPRLSCATPKFISFLGRLSELRKESTILFEEEKQNLFIDEVREVDVWSARLRQLSESSYNEDSLNALFSWASNGLSSLGEILAKEAEKDGLLGWASKPETFTLGVRLFSVAGAVISKDSAASRLLGQGQVEVLKEKLQALLASGEASLLHDDWVSRIQDVLELS
ncbi:THADA/TRM732 family protein [Aspergillus niger CBS 101883]|uniref:THADA/TRM732 family protein n=1 Tax=Aspergillus lacticoffeatus (strain CBS 101883) TaxID=1450533 RepID=UPI000D7FF5D6|nr:HEAT repeat protein [Aspergillus niger CBS 101883]PYH62216.1 HEAT repeat protein [Aspergillus niger CBS 101883]